MPETGTISVAEAALEFERIPSRDAGPTLVLLHEGLGCVGMWKAFPQRLHEGTGLEVFTYSRAGYGHSSAVELPRPLDFHTREALDVLPSVLELASIRECILVGHSDGASIAIIYAGVRRDPRIRGLLLLAPHVLTEACGIETITASKQAYESSHLRTKLARYHGDNVDCAFRGWCDTWLDPGFRRWNIERYLPAISVPVMTLRGNDDPYSTATHVERIAAGVSGTVETIGLAECGHAPHLEQAHQTLELASGFVTRVTGRDPGSLTRQ